MVTLCTTQAMPVTNWANTKVMNTIITNTQTKDPFAMYNTSLVPKPYEIPIMKHKLLKKMNKQKAQILHYFTLTSAEMTVGHVSQALLATYRNSLPIKVHLHTTR